MGCWYSYNINVVGYWVLAVSSWWHIVIHVHSAGQISPCTVCLRSQVGSPSETDSILFNSSTMEIYSGLLPVLLGQDAVNTTFEKFCRPFPATVVHRKSILDMHTVATNADPWNGVETFCSLITTPTYPHLELGIISRILIIAVNV